MADSRWRAGAKVVGHMEVALISMSLAVYAVTKNARERNFKEGDYTSTDGAVKIKFFGDNNRVYFFNQDGQPIVEGTTPPATQVVALIGLIAVVSGLQIWAAVKLLNASEIGTEPKQALKNARFWRLITTLIFISTLCAVYGMGSSSSTADILVVSIFLIWRGVHLYVISRFIKELEKIVASQTQTVDVPSLTNPSVNMADSVWRARARVAANLDFALLCIRLSVVAAIANAKIQKPLPTVGVVTVWTDDHDPSESEGFTIYHVIGFVLGCAIIGLGAAENGFQILAAVKLLNASEIGTEPNQALKNARFWKKVTIFVLVPTLLMLVLFGIAGASIDDILLPTIFVTWRGVHLYVVSRFIKEQEKIVASQNHKQTQTTAEPMNLLAKQ